MATIPIVDVLDVERLPIDAQDIITRVRLVIAGSPAGLEPAYLNLQRFLSDVIVDGEVFTYFPRPVVFEYMATEHATLGCTRSLALPEGFNPFLAPYDPLVPEPSSVSGFTNPGTPSAIRDGDPITFAERTGVGSIEYATAAGTVGYKLKFEAESSSPSDPGAGLFVSLSARRPEGYFIRSGDYLQSELGEDVYRVMPHDARNESVNTPGVTGAYAQGLTLTAGADVTSARVFEFYPLILNTALLTEVAKANVRLPASNPQRVTVTGYVPPDRSHTITGWPGGDFTGTVAQHQYEIGRTIIDFEQAGAPAGLPAEAIEAARERTAAVNAAVSTASYSLKMGERQ